MPDAILVRGARQLLTLRGPNGPRRGPDLRNLGLIQDGAVLIVDGLIREVGPSRRVENLALARRAEEIDASGCVVLPGFVDCHTQLAAGSPRLSEFETRLAGDTPEDRGNGPAAWAMARSIHELSFRALEALAVRALEDAIRHGATALETQSGLGLTEAGGLKMLRVHSSLQKRGVPVLSTLLCARPAPGSEHRPDEYLDWVSSRLLPVVKRRKLAQSAAIRCEPGGFTVSQARRFLEAARKLGFALRLSADCDSGAVALAAELSIDRLDLTDATDAEIATLSQSSAVATLLPGRAFYLGQPRFAPARRWIDQGLAVALASGYNPETCPSQNMQMMIALACTAMKLTPAEAISAATINAAHALGRAAQIGSLEPGKSANLLLLSVPDYREIPYHFGVNLMNLVMVSGNTLVRRPEVRWPAI